VNRAWGLATSVALWGTQAQAQAATPAEPEKAQSEAAQSEADRTDWCIARHREAQADRRQGRLLAANEALRQCLRPECSPVLREDCARLLTEVEQDIPSVVFVAESAEGDLAHVAVYDGQRRIASSLDGAALRLDPGEHNFTFEAAGRLPASRSVVLRVGERNRRIPVRLEPVPAPPTAPGPRRETVAAPAAAPGRDHSLTYSLLGTGAALGVSGLWLALSAKNDYDDAEAACAPKCGDAVQDEIRRKSLAADGLFVLSGALLAWGVVRLYTTGDRSPSATVWLGPGQVTAKGRF
jgi:hypothetical protein